MKTSGLFLGAALTATVLSYTPLRQLPIRSDEYLPRHGTPVQWTEPLDDETAHQLAQAKGASGIEFNPTWGGAVIKKPPPGDSFKTVKGTFKAPANSPGFNTNATHWVTSAWVGIDGDTYQKEILQAGVDTTIFANGTHWYRPWVEYYPRFTNWIHDLEICAGDSITVTVTAKTPSVGVAILENETTGASVTRTVTAPHPSATIVGKNAEWIIEAFTPFADYHTLEFSDVEAVTAAGESVGLENASILEIKSDGKILTDCSIQGSDSVACTYPQA